MAAALPQVLPLVVSTAAACSVLWSMRRLSQALSDESYTALTVSTSEQLDQVSFAREQARAAREQVGCESSGHAARRVSFQGDQDDESARLIVRTPLKAPKAQKQVRAEAAAATSRAEATDMAPEAPSGLATTAAVEEMEEEQAAGKAITPWRPPPRTSASASLERYRSALPCASLSGPPIHSRTRAVPQAQMLRQRPRLHQSARGV